MSLPHALLTSLLERASSGSELARRFDRSIGYFWHATHQQIYRELGRLERAGWIESLPPESGRGRKRAYRVLPAGREELKRWVGESQDTRALRSEMLVRLRAEAVVGPTALYQDVQRQLQAHQRQLAQYHEFAGRDYSTPPTAREQRLQQLVLQAGIMLETMWVELFNGAQAIFADDHNERGAAAAVSVSGTVPDAVPGAAPGAAPDMASKR